MDMKTLTFDDARFGYWTPRRRMAAARLALLVSTFGIIAASTGMAIVSLF